MIKIQLLIDRTIVDDNANRFVKALKKCAKEKNIEVEEVFSIDGYSKDIPHVVVEPNSWALECKDEINHALNCDDNAVVQSIIQLIKDISYTHVLVIGRGVTVGKPLVNAIMEQTNHAVTVMNSHSGIDHLVEMIHSCPIIINASPAKIKLSRDLGYAYILDVSGTFKHTDLEHKTLYVSMRDIGRRTVRYIMDRCLGLSYDKDRNDGDIDNVKW